MDAKYLAEIKAREQVATPGPWKPIEKGNTVPSHAVFAPSIDGSAPVNICSGISPKTGNADFISHSRADIPALRAEVERLTAENATLTKALEWAEEHINEIYSYLDYDYCGSCQQVKEAVEDYRYGIQQAQGQEAKDEKV